MHQCIKFILFWNETVHFSGGLSVYIRSSRLYVQQQAVVKQILLYVQSGTPDDERKDRPKHIECHSKIK